MEGTYRCRWCGRELVTGDPSNRHHLLREHSADWCNELERQGWPELAAHQRIVNWAKSPQAVGLAGKQ